MINVQNSRYVISAVEKKFYPELPGEEIVLLGRSNVGKSTFINRFANRKNLAYISSRPGKTQTLNFYYINDNLTFVDVPGYGYARVSKKLRAGFGNMIEQYLLEAEKLQFVILLIDFKVGPTKDDILMLNFLKFNHIDTIVIATKKDKIKNSIQYKTEKEILEKLEISPTDFFAYSANSNKDVIKIHEIIKAKFA